jgi:hypothetical protein
LAPWKPPTLRHPPVARATVGRATVGLRAAVRSLSSVDAWRIRRGPLAVAAPSQLVLQSDFESDLDRRFARPSDEHDKRWYRDVCDASGVDHFSLPAARLASWTAIAQSFALY